MNANIPTGKETPGAAIVGSGSFTPAKEVVQRVLQANAEKMYRIEFSDTGEVEWTDSDARVSQIEGEYLPQFCASCGRTHRGVKGRVRIFRRGILIVDYSR